METPTVPTLYALVARMWNTGYTSAQGPMQGTHLTSWAFGGYKYVWATVIRYRDLRNSVGA